MRVALRVVTVVAKCVVPRAMIEINKERACCVVGAPLRSTTAVGDVRLEPDRSSLCVAVGPHSRLVRGAWRGSHWSGTLRLGWAHTVDSHGRGIADPNFWRCRRGAPPSHLSPSSTPASTLPRRPKRSPFTNTLCASHCYRASPRTASLRSTHCIPTRKRPRNALPTHWFNQKCAELRANQEAGTGTEQGDKKKAEKAVRFARVW